VFFAALCEKNKKRGISGGIPVVYRDLEMQIGEVLFKAKIAWSLNGG